MSSIELTILRNVRESLDRLEALEKITDRAERKWCDFPENTELENDFDNAYEKEYEEYKCLSILIADYLEIDDKTARNMIRTRRNEVKGILGKAVM